MMKISLDMDDTSSLLGAGPRSSKATSLDSTETKVTSEVSLMYTKNVAEQLYPPFDDYTQKLITALELSVIFEDLVDTMTAISNAVPAPLVEIRTAASIIEDDYFNRPSYGGLLKELTKCGSKILPKTPFAQDTVKPVLPPIEFSEVDRQSQKSKRQSARSSKGRNSKGVSKGSIKARRRTSSGKGESPGSAGSMEEDAMQQLVEEAEFSFYPKFRRFSSPEESAPSEESVKRQEEDAMKGWLMRQFYKPKVSKRIWQSNKETPVRTLDEMVKSAGLKKSNAHHKLQADIGSIKAMMADIFNELVQRGTWDSLEQHLVEERTELLSLSKGSNRLKDMRAYSKQLKAQINETKQSKIRELEALQLLEYQIEDEGQELRMRTEMEAVYTQNIVAAKIQESKKMSERSPNRCQEEIQRVNIWITMEEEAHLALYEYLIYRIQKASSLLDYWTEKYETDKERLIADLEEIKEERAAMASHKQRLEVKIQLWMPIILDNRRIVAAREEEERYRKKCAYYATKVAARWRGFMVRAGIGRFRDRL